MKGFKFLCTVCSLFYSLGITAIEKVDTLYSTKNDRLIVTYDVAYNNGRVTIRFADVKKKLGTANSDKYKKLNEVAVAFFDRTGNYDDLKFSGITVNAFMVPSGVNYSRSSDGYFLLNDSPVINFDVNSGDVSDLSIPIYLAHYEGKRKYEIFIQCGNLVIPLKENQRSSTSATVTTQVTVTSTEEIESGLSEEDEAQIRINRISDLLQEQRKLPLAEELTHEISMLRELRYKITDRNLSSKIAETLANYDIKKQELEAKAEQDARKAQEEAAQEAKLEKELAQARQDSINAIAEQKAEKQQQRNLWMIIGGVALAILGFVGNQVMQHFRNLKSQKNIMEMQQSMAKKAESEAKRRAEALMKNQTRQVANEVKQKAKETVKENVGKVKENVGKMTKNKNNKGFSI